MEITAELVERVRNYAASQEKKKRFQHSLRVAETCRLMCTIYGEDPDRGYFAGLAHDICKDIDEKVMEELAGQDGYDLCEAEIKKPALLHGRAAAVVLKRDFGVDDEEILQAVARHTLGCGNMCTLAKIVYAADKIEPGRPQSTDEYRENLFSMPVDDMVRAVLEENMEYLKQKGKKSSPLTMEFYKSVSDKKEMEGR
ncbi:bis(5'-nucleosyl)-tetraphosphatase (symmetrical) YqeK [Treponema sp.]|uniref:bis(5'-nucleosyl)-tetraphosphatase (symmetrical) YqeK n=1 Tax=Treponema sp. TaxID=166 RepID=UPI0026000057|nr:bis(5'-nucleosyl)-tetraphosphatase (symmetrical) YqeK [Treponema sp.]MCR5219270.1 bis(5'-nucleosyl)-tetraphosphatase (symmetrical) YqeK [Treponema sp.]